MSKPAWGHVSRHCERCGKVGPRVHTGFGWIHAYCRTEEEKRALRQEQYESAKTHAQRLARIERDRVAHRKYIESLKS